MIASGVGSVADIACSDCGAAAGSWCVRHGRTQPGPLLACVGRQLAFMASVCGTVACPVGEISGERHSFRAGAGVVVPWEVMGDLRQSVTVCPDCAEHSEPDICDMCGSGLDVAGGICAACFGSAPVGVWVS